MSRGNSRFQGTRVIIATFLRRPASPDCLLDCHGLFWAAALLRTGWKTEEDARGCVSPVNHRGLESRESPSVLEECLPLLPTFCSSSCQTFSADSSRPPHHLDNSSRTAGLQGVSRTLSNIPQEFTVLHPLPRARMLSGRGEAKRGVVDSPNRVVTLPSPHAERRRVAGEGMIREGQRLF